MNINRNSYNFIQENALKNVACKMSNCHVKLPCLYRLITIRCDN